MREVLRAAAAVAVRPSLWWTALVQARRLAPRRWWGRRPFLPLPDPAYMRFRRTALYGDPDRPLSAEDAVAYLRWCRGMRRGAR